MRKTSYNLFGDYMSVREKLLAELDGSDGFRSGGELARLIGVSRNAVWKAAGELSDEGYSIETVKGKGYRLSENNSKVFKHQIERFAGDAEIVLLEDTESTNSAAKQLADNGGEEKTVVIALKQNAGRGRLGRSFFSPPGGIYMSIILRPLISPEKTTLITAAAAVAAARAVERFSGRKTGIKWVNDIYIDGKKICGILTEGVFGAETGLLDYAVVGIGVNLCGREEQLPREIRNIAGFVTDRDFTSLLYSRFVGELLKEFFVIYGDIENREFLGEYRNRSVLMGKTVTFFKNGTERTAKVEGIDDGARLVVSENGNMYILDSGEVSVKCKNLK